MNLEIIAAQAGLGKTKYIIEDIKKERNDVKIIIITPEQNSYNFEKMLCEEFSGTFNIDVMNFNSIIKYFAKQLKINDGALETEIKYFYYLEVAKNLRSSNNFLVSRILQDITFIDVVDDLIKELKEYNISVDFLEEYCNKLSEDSTHKQKMCAILEIYREYQNLLITNKKFDRSDYINNVLLYIDYLDLSNIVFYFDGYYNLTALEYVLMQKIIEKSKKTVISVVTDIEKYTNFKLEKIIENYEIKKLSYKHIDLEILKNDSSYNLDIFRKSHEMMASINNIIKSLKINNYKIITMLEKNNEVIVFGLTISDLELVEIEILNSWRSRYNNSTLAHISKEYPKVLKSKIDVTEKLKIFKIENIELEVKNIAREIVKLKNSDSTVQNSDIAILYRDKSYEKYNYIFKNYGLAVHLDENKDVTNHRLIRIIKNIIFYNPQNISSSILDLVKTRLTNFESIYKNYALKYILCEDPLINDRKFEKILNEIDYYEKIKNYSGILIDSTKISKAESKESITSKINAITIDELEEILSLKLVAKINDINSEKFTREKGKYSSEKLYIVQQILLDLNKLIVNFQNSKTTGQFVKRIVAILNYFDIKMLLEKSEEQYDNLEELNFESVDRQVYSKLIKILDNIYTYKSDYKISLDDFSKILLSSVDKINYRFIPITENMIVMSTVDLAKIENKKVVFVLGFNKDIYPRKVSSKSILDDSDKELILENTTIIMSPSKKSLLIDEEFVSYLALTRASDMLFLSYSKLGSDFKEQSPSIYLNSINAIFNNINVEAVDPILKFSLDNIKYYEKIENYCSYMEFKYIYNKLLQSYIEIKSNTKNNFFVEQLESLIIRYNSVIKNNNNIIINDIEVDKILSDKIILEEDYYINSYQLRGNSVFKISNNMKNNFLEKKGTSFNRLSASKLTEYNNNPYLFFVKRVLEIKEKEKFGINNLNIGTFFHAVLDNNLIKSFINTESERLSTISIEENISEVVDENKISKLLEKVLSEDTNPDICEFLELFEYSKLTDYTLQKLKVRIIKAIVNEIIYQVITGYKIHETEKRFKLTITEDTIVANIGGNSFEKKLSKKYNIQEVVFNGIIDRIDVKDNKYIVIDYKSSLTDFKYKEFYYGEISQLLTYILAYTLSNEISLEHITGVFYREIATEKEVLTKYRLRGLVNSDILLQEDFAEKSSDVIVTSVTKKGVIHGRDKYKAYTSTELEKLQLINIDNIMKTIEEINNFNFTLGEDDSELCQLYKFANSKNTKLEKDYPKINNNELKVLLLEKNID